MNSKFPHIGTSVFTVMSALAHEYKAINLSQGFPDFDCDPRLAQFAADYSLSGHNQYAPMAGLPVLRQKIAALYQKQYALSYDWESETTICIGATEALFATIMAIVRPGEEVIIIEPAYDAYRPAIEMAGGKVLSHPLSAPDYQIDWLAVEQLITDKTRLLLLNSPHNPTGKMLKHGDIEALEQIISRHPLFIASDEVYEYITFDSHKHLCLAQSPKLRERSIIISSFGKSLHTTGWKVGYAMAPESISTEIRKVHQYITFSVATPLQYAINQYLGQYPEQLLAVGPMYEAKRNLFLELMAGSRFKALSCEGSYFQLMDYSGISDMDDVSFARWLTTEIGVAAIPLSPFYASPPADKVVRFCFAKRDDTLRKACQRLVKI
ncbi:MAG: methionine aminotransferase [Bacteroidota bacterium]